MSGDGIGTLQVFRRSPGHLHLLLNLTGDQGNYWQLGEVPLSDIWDFQVIFEGKVGRKPKGDICLDDITFSPGCLLASSGGGESENTPRPAGIKLLPDPCSTPQISSIELRKLSLKSSDGLQPRWYLNNGV